MGDAQRGLRAKIERAYKHVQELDEAVRLFVESDPYAVVPEKDPDRHWDRFVIGRVDAVPPTVAVIFGDVLHDARSVLDQLAWQADARPTVGTGGTSFPILDSREEFEAKGLRRMSVPRQGVEAVLRELKPYRGGNDALWTLHQLNLRDKHRLAVVAAAAVESFDIPYGDIVSLLVTRQTPLKRMEPGDDLITQPRTSDHHYPKPTITVALYESGIVEGQPLVPFAHGLVRASEGTVEAFLPILFG